MDVTASLRSPAAQVLRGGGQVAVHLDAQFAGGHHDQRAGDAGERPRSVVGGDALQQRHAERQGLAHAGAGLTDEVVAGQRQRQRQFLDGEGVFDAVFGQCAHDFLADAEFGKGVVSVCGHASTWMQCSSFR